jgi:protein-S-isoprenylcysteine O-methyltransferase Ste14
MQSMLWHVLFYSWFLSEILIAVLTRTKRDTGGNVQDRGSMLILWLVIFASIFSSQWIAATQPANMPDVLKSFALLAILFGLAVRWTAVFSLGKAFSANVAIRESQKVKTTGLYALVRHPSYLGLLLVFLAVGLHSRHWLALTLAVVPPTAALLYRIHVEEAALRRAFGEEYARYCKRTKRLIPGLL